MDRKIREAFGEVRAGEALKESTLAYVARKTGGSRGNGPGLWPGGWRPRPAPCW